MSYPLFHPESSAPHPMVLGSSDFGRTFPAETGFVEFKQSASNPSRIQDAVVGFSNNDGGVLLIGVDSSGKVIGVSDPGETERRIHQAIRETFNPGRYEVVQVVVDDLIVLTVAVARRREGFAQTAGGVVKVRSGASNLPLIGEALNRFIQERAFSHFEDSPTKVKVSSADSQLIERLRVAFGWSPDAVQERLLDSGFATAIRGESVLTVAGALLLLSNPSDLGMKAQVEILRFPRGADDPDKRLTIGGPADLQVERATQAILDELGETSVILGARRVDTPKIPPTAIREAMANAVAHRSYESTGTGIRVEIREDEVRIISPGALPEPVTEKNIRDQQASRNQRVLGALRRFGLAEDLGRGIDRIEDDMAAQLLHPPAFHDNGSSVTVVLRSSGLVTPIERAWLARFVETRRLQPNDLLVLVQSVRDGSITNSQVRTLLGIDSLSARSILQRLRDEGMVVQEGERGGATYRPADHLGMPTGVRLGRPELEASVLQLAAGGPINNSIVRAEFALDRVEARNVLQALVEQGRLAQTGTKRGTRYILKDADV